MNVFKIAFSGIREKAFQTTNPCWGKGVTISTKERGCTTASEKLGDVKACYLEGLFWEETPRRLEAVLSASYLKSTSDL